MEHFLLKILVGNYFMSSSEMVPWKYSLVKIKPDLRLPSKYPTHFKLRQSIMQNIVNNNRKGRLPKKIRKKPQVCKCVFSLSMQNHSRTSKTCFTLGMECICLIYSHQDSFESSLNGPNPEGQKAIKLQHGLVKIQVKIFF